MLFFRRVMLSISVLLCASVSVATPQQLEADFEALKDSAVDYVQTGTVCEEVAKLRLQEVYPQEDYQVVTGISYFRSSKTVGELDVVVFRSHDSEAVAVAEVKCWRKLSRGLSKAKQQISRFKSTLRSNKIDSMKGNGQEYSADQFDEDPEFITISQTGGLDKGYTMDIDLTLEESHKLRQRLMQCQKRGECKKP